MLIDELKKQITEVMKAKRMIERDILRLAVSEMQAAENRSGSALSEEDAHKVVRKIIKSIDESLEHVKEGDAHAKLSEEKRILESILPKRLDLDQIIAALQPIVADIKAAKSAGQATGVAMKKLKELGAAVDGDHVKTAVERLRAE